MSKPGPPIASGTPMPNRPSSRHLVVDLGRKPLVPVQRLGRRADHLVGEGARHVAHLLLRLGQIHRPIPAISNYLVTLLAPEAPGQGGNRATGREPPCANAPTHRAYNSPNGYLWEDRACSPSAEAQVRPRRPGGHHLRLRHRPDRQHLPRDRRGDLRRDVPARLGRGRALLRHRADVRPRPVGAPHRPVPALEARATISCCPPRSAACCAPRRAAASTSRPGSTPRPSRWSSTTATTARCAPSRTASSASRSNASTSSSSTTSTCSPAAPTSPRCSARRWTAAGGAREAALREAGQGHRRRRQRMGGLPRGAASSATSTASCSPGRYTLLEQDALDAFLPLCEERGAAVVVGGGFNSGILATGAKPGAKYNYAPAPAAYPRQGRQDRGGLRAPTTCRCPPPRCSSSWPIRPSRPSAPARGRSSSSTRTSPGSATRSPADFWADLKAQGLLREDAPTP